MDKCSNAIFLASKSFIHIGQFTFTKKQRDEENILKS